MNKKAFGLLTALIGIVTIIFVGLGFVYEKSENEKQNGLTAIFDVSATGVIATVRFEKGKAGIYLNTKDDGPIVQFPVEQKILDISFSNDGKRLAYVVSEKESSSDSISDVHLLDIDTKADILAFSVTAIITELAFDPKNPDKLFYLQADVFTNYSPITGKRPHDFDVHSYNLDNKTQTRHTDLKKYGMQSLHVSATDESVFVQMDDDENVQSADELFASYQRIFKIPLDMPDEKEIISNPTGQQDIYDFLVLPELDEIIYQAVGGTKSNGTYEYELFSFNWETNQTKQLTRLKEYAAKPILGSNQKIYFLVDLNFAGRTPDYTIYQMDLDGENIVEILW
ncbi:hypothetical protein H9649_10495 [Sporosarcina sp. Sa2YVA2]|uniref:Uncharacterized protein n=1 Tax=Sporosarcina quadrami TaxID=2762234 RepID=A0ABR8UAE6_9BACL|nr:hypothetical protein [Sporosarcina quadrami]MBD7985016.1 hypothetical protein [Sporosarcina quadrami]